MSGEPTAAEIIEALGLVPHPEGGYFVETWRAVERLDERALPARYRGPRAYGTAIYYLLTPEGFSALHRLHTDEVWHHHAGAEVEMLLLAADGNARTARLGRDLRAGARPQVVVPAGTWQGARVVPGGEWALCGCTMAPGFDGADFVLGRRAELRQAFPAHAAVIEAWTRP